MSHRVTEAGPAGADHPERALHHRPAGLRGALAQGLVGVAVLVVLGAVAGVVWEWVWSAPVGAVSDHRWVAVDEAGLRDQFSGTGWFVVVAFVAGLLGGGLVSLFLDRRPLVTLASLVVGSVLGTSLMLLVGEALGPSDPAGAAATARDGTRLPDQLEVAGHSPWIAMPAGALVALALVFFGLANRHPQEPDDR
jgi:hypothetical protein